MNCYRLSHQTLLIPPPVPARHD